MRSIRSMRVPLIVSGLILVVAVGLVWRDHQRLAAARATHADLVARAVAEGVKPDPAGSGRWSAVPRRPSLDRDAEARRVAAEFIAYAAEMSALGDDLRSPDEATRQRIIDQMDRIKSLDGKQLRILAEEICSAEDLERSKRLELFRFVTGRMTEDHPQKSLELLLTFPGALELTPPGNGIAENLIMDAFRSWSRRDPQAAMEWHRESQKEIPEALLKNSWWGLIQGSAGSHPGLAFQLMDEVGMDPKSSVPQIARAVGTAEERWAVLGAMRQWDGDLEARTVGEVIQLLALGQSYQPEGFEMATAWISKAKLSQDELGKMVAGMERSVQLGDSGRWIEWVGETLPPGQANEPIRELMTRWVERDDRAAEAWLDQLDESLTKEVAAQALGEAGSR